jgi:hypothetical protein
MLKQVLEAVELLDSAFVDGAHAVRLMESRGLQHIEVNHVVGGKGETDFLKIIIPGVNGELSGGKAPTIGIIGQLGGIGARPHRQGLVSDADGAIVAIACALKFADMMRNGDATLGDIIITTHICPRAPVRKHSPVPFMDSPVDVDQRNEYLVDSRMKAILSVDTTKGNRVINHKGIAITPIVRQGYILRVSEDLLDIMEWCTGKVACIMPITTQDITPYGNKLYHINSILQPCTATDAPVLGVAITTETAVPGWATGTSNEISIEEAARFCIEVAKSLGAGNCNLYYSEEFSLLLQKYGSLKHLQTVGRVVVPSGKEVS